MRDIKVEKNERKQTNAQQKTVGKISGEVDELEQVGELEAEEIKEKEVILETDAEGDNHTSDGERSDVTHDSDKDFVPHKKSKTFSYSTDSDDSFW